MPRVWASVTGLGMVWCCLLPLSAFVATVEAKFSASTVNTSTWSAAAVFPPMYTTIASYLDDETAGSADSWSDPTAAIDTLITASKNLPTSFNTSKYYDVDFGSPLPNGVSVSNVQMSVTFTSASGSSDQTCGYLQAYNAADSTLYLTSGTGCTSGSGNSSFTLTLNGVTSSTDANTLRARIIARNASGLKMGVEQAIVTGTMTVNSVDTNFALYRDTINDHTDGVNAFKPWTLAYADANTTFDHLHTTAAPTTFSSTRFLDFTFPYTSKATVPTNATISAVNLRHAWYQNNTTQLCYYAAVYSSAGTLLGTVGSSSSPTSCRTSTSSSTDTLNLSSLANTPAKVNGMKVRLYYRGAATGAKAYEDLMALDVNYTLPP